MIMIFPRAAEQIKKRYPQGSLNPPNTLLKEMRAFTTTQDTIEGSTLNDPLLEETHKILSSPSHLTLIEYDKL
jgi:hypothetical protein